MSAVLPRRLLVAVVAALALALAAAAGVDAATVTSHDSQGRTITFDVRAPNVDTEWYASVLRAAAHGNEISTGTIRSVREPQIPARCAGTSWRAMPFRTAGTTPTSPRGSGCWRPPASPATSYPSS